MNSGQWIVEEQEECSDLIQERSGRGMFTDQETKVASLMKWIKFVRQEINKNCALVSYRK